MRLPAGLTVVGALLLMSGVLMTLVGEALRLSSPRPWQALVSAGEFMAGAGLACGFLVMVAVAVSSSGRRSSGLRAAALGQVAQPGYVVDWGQAAEWQRAAEWQQAADWGQAAERQRAARWGRAAEWGQAADWAQAAEQQQAAELGQAADWGQAAELHVTADWDHAPDWDPVGQVASDCEPVGQRERAGQWERIGQWERAGQQELVGQWEPSGQPETPRRGHDAAVEEWLSQFRAPPAPADPQLSFRHEHVQEHGIPSGYADDGWRPEGITAGVAARWPEPAFAQDDAAVNLGSRHEPLPSFDLAADPRRDYLARSLPSSAHDVSQPDGSGLPVGERAESLAVDDTIPLPAIGPVHDLVEQADPSPRHAAPPEQVPAPARAKLDQIKDLYLTVEAIGEDALGKHFDEVSERQRQLIREYFNQAGVDPGSLSRMTSDQGQDTAALLS